MIPHNTTKNPYLVFDNKNICITGGHDASLDIPPNTFHIGVNAHYKRQSHHPDIYFGSSYEEAISTNPDKPIWMAFINRADNIDLWAKSVTHLFTFDRERTIKPKQDYRDEWLNTFQHQINDNPLSGMVALRYFSLLPVKSIYVSGMDFYCSHPEYFDSPEYIWPHHIPTQRTWARELWRTDLRVSYSPHLMRVLNLEGEQRGVTFVTEVSEVAWDEFRARAKL